MTSIKVNSSNSNQDKEKQRMAKYPAITEGFPKEELPYRFINNVGQEGSYEEESDIYAACQESKPQCLTIWDDLRVMCGRFYSFISGGFMTTAVSQHAG